MEYKAGNDCNGEFMIPKRIRILMCLIIIIWLVVITVNAGNERIVTVIRVIDGNTIVVNNENNSEEIIRFVGINTPAPGTDGSNESKSYLESRILGKQIYLNVDDKKPKDMYNRTLAEVLINEENLNKELLCKGYARVIYITPSEFNPYVWEAECTGGHITYRSFVDQDYGFYKVVDSTTMQPAPYENYTLNIRVGDTVIWENRASPDVRLTIISEEDLWGNTSADLRWNYQKFEHTFNESGNYSVYIEEYQEEDHQKIVVNPVETPVNTVTPFSTPTAVHTDTPSPTPTGTPTPPSTPGFTLILGLVTIIIIYKSKKR